VHEKTIIFQSMAVAALATARQMSGFLRKSDLADLAIG
jgi:hypothetical protein